MQNDHQYEALSQIFAQSVVSWDSAIQAGDAKLAKLSGRKCVHIAKKLLSSESGTKAFAKLLKDKRIAVSSAAATYLLPHRTDEAIVVLEEAAKCLGAVGLGAVMALARWRGGEKGMWDEVASIANAGTRRKSKGQ